MLFGKGFVVLSVVIFVSWTEGSQASDGFSLKEADHGRMNPTNAETNGDDYPRQKRGKIVGVVINQEGNVYEGDGPDEDNVGIYVRQENNVFRNNDAEGKTYGSIINQNNYRRANSAESDSTKRQNQQSAAHSAKPFVQNQQYVIRNQQAQYKPPTTYPLNSGNNYAVPPAQPQTFQAPPNYVHNQQNGYNGPTRRGRVLRVPAYRPVPQFNGTAMSNNFKILKVRLDSLKIEVDSLKNTVARLVQMLNGNK